MQDAFKGLLAIASGIITLAIISVVISKNSQTPAVVTSVGNAYAGLIKAAVSPGATSGSGISTFASPALSSILND